MQRIVSADFWSGLFFAGIGLIFVLVGREYPYQSAAEMGPGFFPFWLGSGLALYGLALAVKALLSGSELVASFSLKPGVLILAGLLLFAFLLDRTGLVIAGLVLLGVASIATGGFRPISFAVFATVLIAFASIVFRALLGVSIPIWPVLNG